MLRLAKMAVSVQALNSITKKGAWNNIFHAPSSLVYPPPAPPLALPQAKRPGFFPTAQKIKAFYCCRNA